MNLRNLEAKDAPLMLSWMHDANVTGMLRGNFSTKTLADAEAFIAASRTCLSGACVDMLYNF